MWHRNVEVTDRDDRLADELEEAIYAFNVEVTGFDDGRGLFVSFRDPDGSLVAGLSGWTWGGCAVIDKLWVRSDRRGRGLGRTLLDAAEAEARSRGCAQVVTASHSFQAPDMYERRGYRECGRAEGYPTGHAEVYLTKDLRGVR